MRRAFEARARAFVTTADNRRIPRLRCKFTQNFNNFRSGIVKIPKVVINFADTNTFQLNHNGIASVAETGIDALNIK